MARTSQRSKSIKSVSKPASKVKKVAKNKKLTKKTTPKPTKKANVKKTSGGKKTSNRVNVAKRSSSKVNSKSSIGSPKPQSKKPASSSKPSTPSIKGYSADEYIKYQQNKRKLSSYSNQQLKDILRKNLQSMSGNKDQIIQKVADGMVLGRIPRCPKCFGGRPKFNYKNGIYHCSGYRDDTDFINCHVEFTLAEIKRDKWEQ